jgi:FdhE protein
VTLDTGSKVLKKLAEREKREGDLPLLLRFYRDIVLLQDETRRRTSVPATGLDAGAIRERLRQGVPLLRLEDLEAHIESLQQLFGGVREIFRAYPGLFGELPDGPAGGHRLNAEIVRAWFEGGPMPPAALDGADEATLQAMVHLTFKPLLAARAEALSSSIDSELWRRRYCPVCGGIPDMAYLDRERGARWLLCSRCDFTWLFHRLQCPHCGTEDHNALSFFTDEPGFYRLHVCERCKCYLKTIDLRKTDDEVILPLERLMTGDIDRKAREEGYRLPA